MTHEEIKVRLDELLNRWEETRWAQTEANVRAVRHGVLRGGTAEFTRLYHESHELEQKCVALMEEIRVLGAQYRDAVKDHGTVVVGNS